MITPMVQNADRSDFWPRILDGVDTVDVVAIGNTLVALVGTVLAAVIAAAIAVRTYRTQQRDARRQERARFYAEALQAVEDYMEGPYRICRRDGSATARREITQHLSDVKSRLSYYTGWMQIYASLDVSEAFSVYYRAAMTEAGAQMTSAWKGRPTKRDQDVPIGTAFPRTATNAARNVLLTAMKSDLRDR